MSVSNTQILVCFLRIMNFLTGGICAAWVSPLGILQYGTLLHVLWKTEVHNSWNLIMEMTSPNFCCVLFIGNKKLNSACTQGDGILEKRREAGGLMEVCWEHWERCQKLPMSSMVLMHTCCVWIDRLLVAWGVNSTCFPVLNITFISTNLGTRVSHRCLIDQMPSQACLSTKRPREWGFRNA